MPLPSRPSHLSRPLGPILVVALALGACSKPPSPEDAAKKGGAEAGAKKEAAPPAPETPEQKKLMRVAALGPLPPGPVAIVGGDEITLEQFRTIYDLKLAKYQGKGRNMSKRVDARYRRSITERLIRQEILAREAKAQGVDYDPAELAAIEAETRRRVRDWATDLARRGESDQTLRDLEIARLRETAILEKTVDLSVSPQEIDEEYERIKGNFDKKTDRYRGWRVVFEKAEFGTMEKALERAREARAQMLAPGADFAKVGQQFSKSLLSSDLGIRRADEDEKRLIDIFVSLEVGGISEPIEIQDGYEIIKLVGKWGPGPLPKEALLDMLVPSLEGRRRQDKGVELMTALTKKYEVRNLMEPTIELSGGPSKAEKGGAPGLAQGVAPHGAGEAEAPAEE